MYFNSLDFAIFLPLVFALFWALKPAGIRVQNVVIVFASYVFYGWWDWKFLSLIVFSTFIDYLSGIMLSRTEKSNYRKAWVGLSLLSNLGLLGFFKYYNFFVDSFAGAFSFMGLEVSTSSLNIILPVGISFYTFQTLSYTLDIYNRKMGATRDYIAFSAFVSFFPQLVAGPIERASHLLPQFFRKKKFNYHDAVNGLQQMIWGFVKKMVIADNCAEHANLIFNNYEQYSGSTLLLGALFFTFQIYGDFSGYSDIAIGVSRLFGFDLMKNFSFPYFSRDIAEFWRRWHISLSTWFRDYVYIPLGGNRGSKWKQVRNTFIIFIVSGLWHGANWTYVIWGALNALYFLPLLITGNNRRNLNIVAAGQYLPSFRDVLAIGTTFLLTVLAWIFFRAENVSAAFHYISILFSKSLFTIPHFFGIVNGVITAGIVAVFMIVEWLGRTDDYAIQKLARIENVYLRTGINYAIVMFIALYMANSEQEFIYFQF